MREAVQIRTRGRLRNGPLRQIFRAACAAQRHRPRRGRAAAAAVLGPQRSQGQRAQGAALLARAWRRGAAFGHPARRRASLSVGRRRALAAAGAAAFRAAAHAPRPPPRCVAATPGGRAAAPAPAPPPAERGRSARAPPRRRSRSARVANKLIRLRPRCLRVGGRVDGFGAPRPRRRGYTQFRGGRDRRAPRASRNSVDACYSSWSRCVGVRERDDACTNSVGPLRTRYLQQV